MKKAYVLIILFLFVTHTYSQTEKTACSLFHVLTNDSTKYWEMFNPYFGKSTTGFSFSTDSTWIKYVIDARSNRVIDRVDYHQLYGKAYKFSIRNDSLFLNFFSDFDESWLLYRVFKVSVIDEYGINLTHTEMSIVGSPDGTERLRTVTRTFDVAWDQFTKPEYGRKLYPDDKEKWDMGDMSDSPVRLEEK
jgi:hypothetical protein